MTDRTSPDAAASRRCIEDGCNEPAGTRWSPYWCERHDKERRDRITATLDALGALRHVEEWSRRWADFVSVVQNTTAEVKRLALLDAAHAAAEAAAKVGEARRASALPGLPDVRADIEKALRYLDPDGLRYRDGMARVGHAEIILREVLAALSVPPAADPESETMTDRIEQLVGYVRRMREPDVVRPDEERTIRNIAALIEGEARRAPALPVEAPTRHHAFDVPIGYWCCAFDWENGTFRTSECIGPTSNPNPQWTRIPALPVEALDPSHAFANCEVCGAHVTDPEASEPCHPSVRLGSEPSDD